jgi:hypothetical protein
MSKEFSNYQKKVIKDYYNNLDRTALTRLQELVTAIYLAADDRQKMKLWEKVQTALKQLKIPQAIAEHILKQKDPQILAKNINDWMNFC